VDAKEESELSRLSPWVLRIELYGNLTRGNEDELVDNPRLAKDISMRDVVFKIKNF